MMKIKFKAVSLFNYLLIGLFVYLVTGLVHPFSKVYADFPISLSISPPIFEVLIKPGTTVSQKFVLRNKGKAVKVTPKIVEYNPKGIDPDVSFQPESWIEVKIDDITLNSSFNLPENSEKEVLIEIHPPENTEENEYHRVLLFTTEPGTEKNESESLISGSIGSVLLMTVSKSGNIPREGKITTFDIPLILDSFSPLVSDIYLLNSGKGLIRPTGKITIQSPIYKASYSINTLTLFSGERKILKTDTSAKSLHNANTLFLPGFYIGKYDVEVSLSIGENVSKVVQRKSFYAFPWKLISLLVLLLLIFLIIKRLKKRSKISSS